MSSLFNADSNEALSGSSTRVFSQVQKDKQRSTKHTYKTKDRVTRTLLKTGGELRCSGRVGSSCSTSGIHRVNLYSYKQLEVNHYIFTIFVYLIDAYITCHLFSEHNIVTQIDEDISEKNVRLWHTIIILIILFVIIVTVIVVSLAIVCRYYR